MLFFQGFKKWLWTQERALHRTFKFCGGLKVEILILFHLDIQIVLMNFLEMGARHLASGQEHGSCQQQKSSGQGWKPMQNEKWVRKRKARRVYLPPCSSMRGQVQDRLNHGLFGLKTGQALDSLMHIPHSTGTWALWTCWGGFEESNPTVQPSAKMTFAGIGEERQGRLHSLVLNSYWAVTTVSITKQDCSVIEDVMI